VSSKVLALAALLAAAPAAAESPRYGSFELALGTYRPSIDSEFGSAAQKPFETAFGGKRGLMFRGDVSKSLFVDYGTLEIGLGAGYYERYGHGQLPTGGAASDSTAIRVIPTRLTATYRFDVLVQRWGIPFAPYGRVSLERYNWWVTNGSGGTANTIAQPGSPSRSGSGATNGYSFSGGLAFLLDFIDPGVARDMDRDTGINHTYIFVDVTKSYINDFGSASSWNLSDDRNIAISGGLLFVF
jgi:hypothetical protein